MENKLENEMETGVILWLFRDSISWEFSEASHSTRAKPAARRSESDLMWVVQSMGVFWLPSMTWHAVQ